MSSKNDKYFDNKLAIPSTFYYIKYELIARTQTQPRSCLIAHSQPQVLEDLDILDLLNLLLIPLQGLLLVLVHNPLHDHVQYHALVLVQYLRIVLC